MPFPLVDSIKNTKSERFTW